MKLNYVAGIGNSGYGHVGYYILRSLIRAGHEVCFFGHTVPGFEELKLQPEEALAVWEATKRRGFYFSEAPCLRVAPEFDMSLFAGRGPRCGLTFYETDDFTDPERHHLSNLDLLLVASEWAKEIAVRHSVLPANRVGVIPMGVDGGIFVPAPLPELPTTTFLQIGKWERRKGHDVTLEAFSRAFHKDDPVRLVFLSHNPHLSDAQNGFWVERCRSSRLAEKIELWDRVPTHHDVARVMAQADCGVFPARAEGWNLEILEMMSVGRLVIATDYSAHTEFLTDQNSLKIQVNELEDAHDSEGMTVYNSKRGQWAKLGDPEIDQLVEHMRAVHRLKQEGQLTASEAGRQTAAAFGWERTAAVLTELMESTGIAP